MSELAPHLAAQERALKTLAAAAADQAIQTDRLVFTLAITEILSALRRKGILADADLVTMIGRMEATALSQPATASDTSGKTLELALLLRHALGIGGSKGN